MKLLIVLLSLVVLVLAAWTGASLYFVWGIEEPGYEVLERRNGYEVRRYEPIVVARTQGAGEADEDDLFRVLAGYLFGGNDARQQIQMTAPVLMSGSSSSSTMEFVMPAALPLAGLPAPDDPRVSFEAVPERTVAALEYTWYATDEARREKAAALVAMLARDGFQAAGDVVHAGYQPPFSAPFLMRHEVLLEVVAQP